MSREYTIPIEAPVIPPIITAGAALGGMFLTDGKAERRKRMVEEEDEIIALLAAWLRIK